MPLGAGLRPATETVSKAMTSTITARPHPLEDGDPIARQSRCAVPIALYIDSRASTIAFYLFVLCSPQKHLSVAEGHHHLRRHLDS
jgi:hypothetical protein